MASELRLGAHLAMTAPNQYGRRGRALLRARVLAASRWAFRLGVAAVCAACSALYPLDGLSGAQLDAGGVSLSEAGIPSEGTSPPEGIPEAGVDGSSLQAIDSGVFVDAQRLGAIDAAGDAVLRRPPRGFARVSTCVLRSAPTSTKARLTTRGGAACRWRAAARSSSRPGRGCLASFLDARHATPAYGAGASQPQANLGATLLGTAANVHLEAQIRLDAIGDGDAVVGLGIAQQLPDGSELQLDLILVDGSQSLLQEQQYFADGTFNANNMLIGSVPLGTWIPYVLDLHPGMSGTLTLSVNGVRVLDQPLTYAWQPSPFAVQVGIGYISATGGTETDTYGEVQMHADNIAAYVQ